jgi:DNA-binding LacI/PurR family transcriptional regulator
LQVVADRTGRGRLYRRWAAERRVDGVLVCDLRVDDPRIPVLEELELPTVVIGSKTGAGALPSVGSDDAAAVVDAIDYLRHAGPSADRPGGRGSRKLLHTAIRTAAFEEACRRLEIVTPRTISTDYSGRGRRPGHPQAAEFPRPPTAILYDNDVMAIAGLAVAHELGLAVPADVSPWWPGTTRCSAGWSTPR